MFLLHINHAHQLQLATATPENHFFPHTNLHFCNVYCLVPNIRYRPNIRQLFLAEYSFSAETRKSVFGRSLLAGTYAHLPSSSMTLAPLCPQHEICPRLRRRVRVHHRHATVCGAERRLQAEEQRTSYEMKEDFEGPTSFLPQENEATTTFI
jgi:hypothetical protein